MTTLRVIVDEILGSAAGQTQRYAEELTRALIETAPAGCLVEGIVAASTEADYRHLGERLPGLAALHKSALARRELQAAWQHGFTALPGKGMLHAPSLLAPLARHDRLNNGDQIAVTVHDTRAWTDPDTLGRREVSWQRAMLKRAARHADAIVVPSRAVGDTLAELAPLGDRIRVIAAAPSSALQLPSDADERAARLALPDSFALLRAESGSPAELGEALTAIARAEGDVALVIAGLAGDDTRLSAAIAEAGVAQSRVHALGELSAADLAVVLHRAAAFIAARSESGPGIAVLDAFVSGTPVIHPDSPAILELAADAGLAVPADGDYATGLAEAISRVVTEPALAQRLHYLGLDRARAFSWRGSAEKVWQLHADL